MYSIKENTLLPRIRGVTDVAENMARFVYGYVAVHNVIRPFKLNF